MGISSNITQNHAPELYEFISVHYLAQMTRRLTKGVIMQVRVATNIDENYSCSLWEVISVRY